MLILLTNWFTRAERSRANAILILGNPVTVTWMAAATGYLIHAVGWQMTFILEGIPSVLWAFVWIVVARDQPRAGSRGCRKKAASIWRKRSLWSSLPCPQYENFRAALRVPGVLRALLPVFLLELWRLRPCDLDSGDDPLRLGARHRAGRPAQRGAISSRRRADAHGRNVFRSRAEPHSCSCGRSSCFRAWRCFARFATAGHNFWLAYVCLIIAGGTMYAPYGPFFAIMPEMLPRNVAGEVIALVNSLRRAGRICRNLAGGLAAGASREAPAPAFSPCRSCSIVSGAD